jgi:multidrug resistance efflux pump
MLELLLCSLFTVVPDYLFRRYGQGKRLGREITIYSVWYELRYGITGCLMLTVTLIAMIFYFHPTTNNVVGLFRAVPIVPETNGRVAEVYVGASADVAQGEPIFRLDSAKQDAALEVAKRNIAEIDARMVTARAEIAASEGQVQEARGTYEVAVDELRTKREIAHVVARREIERLERLVESRSGTLNAAIANKEAADTKLLHAATGGKGKRGSRAQPGAGRSVQDRCARRRGRTRRAIHSASRRYRKSADAAGGTADP